MHGTITFYILRGHTLNIDELLIQSNPADAWVMTFMLNGKSTDYYPKCIVELELQLI